MLLSTCHVGLHTVSCPLLQQGNCTCRYGQPIAEFITTHHVQAWASHEPNQPNITTCWLCWLLYEQDLAQKMYSTSSVSSSQRFAKPKLSQTAFTIQHYAGPVTYQTENFLDKNKDFVVAEHQQLLQESTTAFVRELFAPDPVRTRACTLALALCCMCSLEMLIDHSNAVPAVVMGACMYGL